MPGSSFGQLFRVTTAGESHGPAMVAIVDGCPAQLPLTEADIQPYLDRRRPGQSKVTSQRQETDRLQILSGVYQGQTLGTPIALLIPNIDAKSRDYQALADRFRPGHADYTYQKKYGIRDPRGGGRASARETVLRVAAGAIAQQYLLRTRGLQIKAYLSQLGPMILEPKELSAVDHNDFFSPDPARVPELMEAIKTAQKSQDSLGAVVTVVADPMPVGLGEPVYDKLDALLAQALMSINAVKGVEIGAGFAAASQQGSEHVDLLTPQGFQSNHAGGVLGGISSGQALTARVAFKPTASIPQSLSSVTHTNEACDLRTTGRHDPCVGIRSVPIVEGMVALVLMDLCLQQQAVIARTV